MAVERIGISLRHDEVADTARLANDLTILGEVEPDFVEVCPQGLGIIVGGQLDWDCLNPAKEALEAAGLGYTVHPPLRLNLMDLDRLDLQRDILESSVRFAGEIGGADRRLPRRGA